MKHVRFSDFAQINPRVSLQRGEEYPYVEMAIVEPGKRYVVTNETRKYKSGGAKFRSGDVLFARITPCLENGKIAQFVSQDCENAFGSTEFFVFRHREGISDPAFLYYLALSDLIRKPAEKSMTGASGRQRAALDTIQELEIPVPDLVTQQHIGVLLSAYDDLIEVNQQRIDALEAAAQALYREWFVEFRFPGHESAEWVTSELGEIPRGWAATKFTDIADVLSGGTPRTTIEEYWNGPIPFFSPKDMPDSFFVLDTERYITNEGLENCSSDLYPPRTIFITARGTVGKVVMPAVDMAMNQSCYALRGKEGIPQYFVFLATLERVEYLKQQAHGAVFDTIIMDTFRRLDMLRPPQGLIDQFSDMVSPMFEGVLNLQHRNRVLRETRDLLLPRLISGEVSVEGLPLPNEEALA